MRHACPLPGLFGIGLGHECRLVPVTVDHVSALVGGTSRRRRLQRRDISPEWLKLIFELAGTIFRNQRVGREAPDRRPMQTGYR